MIAPRFLRRASALVVVASSIFAAGGAALADPTAPSAASGSYRISRFIVTGVPTEVAVDSADGYVYVASPGAGTVSVVNAASGATVKTISLSPYAPLALTVDTATDTVYVAGYDNHQNPVLGAVFSIDGATGTVLKSVTSPGMNPSAIAVDSATNLLYVLIRPGTVIQVMNAASLAVTGTVAAPAGGFDAMAVDEGADKLYVSGGATISGNRIGTLWTIDGTTDAISGPADLGPTNAGALAATFDPAGNTVYVANGPGVLAVDPATGTIMHTFPIAANSLAVDAASGRVFATSPPSTVSVLDASSQSVVATFPRGGWGVTVDSTTGEVYIPSAYSGVWTMTPAASTTMSPAISTPVPTVTALASTPVSVALQVTAIPAATCSTTGTLPAGVTLTPACVLTGVPPASAAGLYTVTVTAANGVDPAFPVTVNIVVDPPLAITSPAAATFIVGIPGSFTVATSPFPYGLVLSQTGTLPAGVTFNSGGLLSGTPATGTAGVYHLTIDANGNQGSSSSQAFTLTVDQIPAFTSPAKVTFTHGKRGTFTIRTTSFPVAHLTEQGKLPAGLAFRAGSGGTATISGTPAASAKGHTFVVTIVGRNAANLTGTQQLTITVR